MSSPSAPRGLLRASLVLGALVAISATACILDLDGLTGGPPPGQGGGGASLTDGGPTPGDSGGDGGPIDPDGGCPLLDCSCVDGPTPLATGTLFADLPRGLALTKEALYWVNLQGGSVMRLAASGGAPAPIATAMSPRAVAASGANLVWSEDDGIHACALPGCADAHLLSPSLGPGTVRAVAFDGLTVAWTDRGAGAGAGKTRACPLGACAPIDVGDGMLAPEGVVIAGNLVHWIEGGNGNANGTVQFSPPTSKSISQIAAALDLPFGVAVDDTYVYWTAHSPQGHVYRCALAGGYCDNPVDIAPGAGDLGRPADIHLGNGRVYWTNDDDGTIQSCPQPGCGAAMPAVHVTGRAGIERLVVGSSCLFWTENEGGGAVLKAPR